MTSASLIFASTAAACTTSEHIVYQCTVDSTPSGEPGVTYHQGAVYE
ncbi:MAG: hypothetical protein ACR2P2_17265 [Nakamurella sp.]